MFNGKTLAEVAGFDLEQNEVEGVSGATMTSLTVARAVLALAEAESGGGGESVGGISRGVTRPIGSRGIGTVLVVLFGLADGVHAAARGAQAAHRVPARAGRVSRAGEWGSDLAGIVGWMGGEWDGVERSRPACCCWWRPPCWCRCLLGSRSTATSCARMVRRSNCSRTACPSAWRWRVPPRLARAVAGRAIPAPAAGGGGRRCGSWRSIWCRSNPSMPTYSASPGGRRSRSRSSVSWRRCSCRWPIAGTGARPGRCLNFLWGWWRAREVFAAGWPGVCLSVVGAWAAGCRLRGGSWLLRNFYRGCRSGAKLWRWNLGAEPVGIVERNMRTGLGAKLAGASLIICCLVGCGDDRPRE